MFSSVARFDQIKSENDANCTYDGENNILIQQTSNWLLKQWTKAINGRSIASPLGTIDFFVDTRQILNVKFSQNTVKDTLKPKSMTRNLYLTT